MPTWPSADGFPQRPLNGTWRSQQGRNDIQFDPDVGAPLVRRRGLVAILNASFNLKLSHAHLAVIKSFWKVDSCEGTVPFQWVNPETGVTETWSWQGPPQVQHETKGAYVVVCQVRRDY